MDKPRVVVFDAGDFFGTYLDGKLIHQDLGQEIDWQKLLRALNISFAQHELEEDAADVITKHGKFPKSLDELDKLGGY